MYPNIYIVLPTYGVLAGIGLMAVLLLLYFRIEKYNLPFSGYLKMFAWSLLFGFIGARAVFVFSRIPWLISHFSLSHLFTTIFGGGYVFYGGLLGVLFGVSRSIKKRGYDRISIHNLVAPAIPLFHSLGRIGCFMAGCCYGFKLASPIVLFNTVKIYHFPTQLIEALFEVLLFVVIMIIQRKRKNIDCLTFYMITYAVFRFLIEFTRGDAVRGVFFGISTSQLISVGILLYYALRMFKPVDKAHK